MAIRLLKLFTVCVLFNSIRALALPSYTIQDLGTLGGPASFATGINNNGQIVGGSYTADDTSPHAFSYANGLMQDLGTPGRSPSVAYAINNSGEIAGFADYSGAGLRSAAIFGGGKITDIGTFDGGNYSIAYAINDNGQIAGYSNQNGIPAHAFLYDSGKMRDLGSFGNDSIAYGINNWGVVVGASSVVNGGDYSAFRYSNGPMQKIATLNGNGFGEAYGINNLGQIVGSSLDFNVSDNYYRAIHAFLNIDGVVTDLGTLGGHFSSANSINDLGQIVGYSALSDDSTYSAFLYSDGQLTDLTNLPGIAQSGWTRLVDASSINDLGQIVGTGYIDGHQHAFLLSPYRPTYVSEPGEILLFLPGLVLLVVVNCRRSSFSSQVRALRTMS